MAITIRNQKASGSMQLLDEYKQAINAAIINYLDTWPSELGYSLDPATLSVHAWDVLDKLREFTLRPGKRIRGVLAAAAYDDAKGTHLAAAGQILGVTQELLQSYILISDDVADRSELRRGMPTVHREYMAAMDKYGDEHEANSLAEYVSLITEQIAHMALLRAPESPKNIISALYNLHRNFTLTGFGQIDDIHHKVGRRVTREDVIRVYSMKTGYYTFVNPLQTGLLLAGITDSQSMQQINEFGSAAGVAFQMHDDYLGVFGDISRTGKPSIDDLKEGKYTILVQYALDHGNAQDILGLRRILGNADIGEADLRQAQRIFNDSGATLYTQTEAKRFAGMAKQQLESIPVLSDYFKAFLSDLIDFAVNRQS